MIEYRHGGDPRSDLNRFGIDERTLLDFSVNLNSLGPPDIIRDIWPDLLNSIEGYPSVEGEGIAHYYCDMFGLSPENLIAANGSTEMIYLTPRALGLKSVVIITPSYHDYERASMLAGAKVTRLPLSAGDEFAFPEKGRIIEAVRDADGLWLGRPNNPTGTMVSKEYIFELAEEFPEKWFIVDEAFIQFVEGWEEKSLLKDLIRPNILVLHSLTKFYAIAGLRLGGIAGGREAISRIKMAKEPWTVNGLADRVAPMLLGCKDYESRTRSLVSKERERIYKKLRESNGIRVFPPSANFFLCQWERGGNLDELIVHLLKNGVYVRDCRNFAGLEEGFFRFGLKSRENNDLLIFLLSSFPERGNV